MLVSATEMLNKAKAGHYAVGQFNINNLEWTKAILQTAQELNSPVILGVSEGAGKYMTGYKTVVGMVNGMLEELNITVPVALHLDHGSYDGCYKCLEAGFSSIMFDGSHYPIDENVEKTTELVKAAHEKGSVGAQMQTFLHLRRQNTKEDLNADLEKTWTDCCALCIVCRDDSECRFYREQRSLRRTVYGRRRASGGIHGSGSVP